MTEEIKKYPSGKKGICVNCRRPAHISDRHGHCKTCANAVRGVVLDEHRAAALAAVKERLQTAKFKKAVPGLRAKAKDLKKYRDAEKTNLGKAREYSRLPVESTLDMTVKQVAQTGIPAIIARAVAERDGHLSEAAKLDKAIILLESLK